MKSVCAYLDLLGFSNYINSNFNEGIELVSNYAHILQMGLSVTEEFSSFEYFLPFSDSIFMISSDADKFVQEVSRFLVQCFLLTSNAYTLPVDPERPTRVVTHQVGYRIDTKSAEVKEVEQNWFPTIFKGGVTFDEVEPFSQKGINDGETYEQKNLAGRGIVKCVSLEKSGRGPRLFCDHAFIAELSDENRRKYVLGSNNVTEILWPTAVYLDSNDNRISLINGFPELFDPGVSLWRAFESTPVGEIYFNLLKLIVSSTVLYFANRDYEKETLEYIENWLNQKKMLHYFKSLTSMGS